jgi:hypothetical protein
VATFKDSVVFEPIDTSGQTTLSFGTFALDATTDALEFIFQMPEAATLTHGGFRYGVRALTPPTYRISLQGVDASGNPDGTIKGGGTPASATFTPPASTAWDGTWQWVAFTNSYAATAGEMLALVIDYSSGTVNGTNNSTFSSGMTWSMRSTLPYSINNNATVRARQTVTSPIFGVKSASLAYGLPLQATTVTPYSSNSTPDEYALAWTTDTAWGDTYQVSGVHGTFTFGAAAKTITVNLYDTDGTTVLQTVTLDTDQTAVTSERSVDIYFPGTLAALTFGSTYKIGFIANDTSTNAALRTIDVETDSDFTALPHGTSAWLETRSDLGSWTPVTTRRPLMGLIVRDWTEPTSGGAGYSRSRVSNAGSI